MNFSSRKIFAIITLSILAVLGHWNFWSHGIYALGFNTTAIRRHLNEHSGHWVCSFGDRFGPWLRGVNYAEAIGNFGLIGLNPSVSLSRRFQKLLNSH